MMNQQPTDHKNQQSKVPLWKQPRVWLLSGMAFGLLLMAFWLWRSSLNSGWTTYPERVTALWVDQQGRVWGVTSNRTIVLFSDDNGPAPIPLPNEFANGPLLEINPQTFDGATSIVIDEQDRIWLGSRSGDIAMRDGNGQWTIYTPEDPEIFGARMAMDGQGQAWVFTRNGRGLIDPDVGGTTYTVTDFGLGAGFVRAMTMDEKGQLWGIYDKDVQVLEADGNWKSYTSLPGTSMLYVDGIAIDPQGQVWISTMNGIISVFRPESGWQSYTLGKFEMAFDASAIVFDNHDRAWVGTMQGVFVFDPDIGWTNYNTLSSGLPNPFVATLAIDRQGRVWVGSQDERSVYNDMTVSAFDAEAASESKFAQIIPIIQSTVIPSAALGIPLLIILAIAFTRPGAISINTLRDFSIGLGGWFVMQSFFWGGFNVIGQQMGPAAIMLVFCVGIPLPLNIGVLSALLYRKRRWVALGVFFAFVINSIGRIVFIFSTQYVSNPILDIFMMVPFFLKLQ